MCWGISQQLLRAPNHTSQQLSHTPDCKRWCCCFVDDECTATKCFDAEHTPQLLWKSWQPIMCKSCTTQCAYLGIFFWFMMLSLSCLLMWHWRKNYFVMLYVKFDVFLMSCNGKMCGNGEMKSFMVSSSIFEALCHALHHSNNVWGKTNKTRHR